MGVGEMTVVSACPQHVHILVLPPQLPHPHHQGPGPAFLFPTCLTGLRCHPCLVSPMSFAAKLFSPSDKWGGRGPAEDGSRGTSVMCPGHKLKLGRDPATELQPRGYPLQDLNPAYATLDKSQKHSEPQFPHLRDRKSIVSTGLK